MLLPNETDYSYFAGLLDGEGTFTVYRTKNLQYFKYTAYMTLTSTNEEVVEWICSKFKGQVSRNGEEKQAGNRETTFQWKIKTPNEILRLLPYVIPFLIIKKVQAQLLLKYCSTCTFVQGMHLSDEERELREAYCTLFSDLNSVGKGSNATKKSVTEELRAMGIELPIAAPTPRDADSLLDSMEDL